MPKITIDGKELEFKQGQTIIEAAKQGGIDIPHFCWHSSLSVSGNCRICLVEVEKLPKLVIACSTLATDGMVVQTASQKTLDARNAVMEFILINHPLDCPICDEAGECKLQDYAYEHSVGESRFIEEKNHKDKRVQLGPRIMFDGERCISCSRCIRFSDEIAGKNQLTFVKRGDRVTITTFPGESFDNNYTLNTVDICPVGALTSADFRFKSRVWEMSATDSVCVGCSRGCNTEVWVRDNKIQRLTPRHNEAVNSHWMCDYGRLNTFKFVNDETRVDGPSIRREGQLIKVSWDEALNLAHDRLREFKTSEIAFIGSAFATAEDNYLFARLAKHMGVHNIDFARHIAHGDFDNLLLLEDKTPNSLGAELAGIKPEHGGLSFDEIMEAVKIKKIKALYILEDDLAGLGEEYAAALGKLDLLIVHAVNYNKTTDYADVVLPSAAFAEKNGIFVNFAGTAQRLKPATTTLETDRALDGMSMSRWDVFGTKFDRWANGSRYDARPSWRIVSMLSQKFGLKLKFQMAEEVFRSLSEHNKHFEGLDYDNIGRKGALVKNISLPVPEKIK